MSALINRVPVGRIVSLHTELKYLFWKFATGTFSLVQMKLDPASEKTQLDFFPFAVHDPKYGRYNGKYDPYLDNPLDKAGFHLTQSVERDSQKSKAASVCFDALEGLGWITRTNFGRGQITEIGKEIASLEYADRKMLPLLRESILNYGPIVGFLFEALKHSYDGEFARSAIVIGYPNTGETLNIDGQVIPLSVGSQDDSLTRTRSTLMAWAMTVGYIWPIDEAIPEVASSWHVEALDLIKKKTWPWSRFRILLPRNFFVQSHLKVDHPLSYQWLTKNTKALRERGQAIIRGATLSIEERVKNRRFAIVYGLALASSKKKRLDFMSLIQGMKNYPEMFIVEINFFSRAMELDLDVAITTGAIFIRDKNLLTPLTSCNMGHIVIGAPEHVVGVVRELATVSLV